MKKIELKTMNFSLRLALLTFIFSVSVRNHVSASTVEVTVNQPQIAKEVAYSISQSSSAQENIKARNEIVRGNTKQGHLSKQNFEIKKERAPQNEILQSQGNKLEDQYPGFVQKIDEQTQRETEQSLRRHQRDSREVKMNTSPQNIEKTSKNFLQPESGNKGAQSRNSENSASEPGKIEHLIDSSDANQLTMKVNLRNNEIDSNRLVLDTTKNLQQQNDSSISEGRAIMPMMNMINMFGQQSPPLANNLHQHQHPMLRQSMSRPPMAYQFPPPSIMHQNNMINGPNSVYGTVGVGNAPHFQPSDAEMCGLNMKELRHERIVGGRNAFFGEVPFIVHLRESQLFRVLGYNKCGGVLINHKWVLTAGHCKPAFYSSLEVILGKYRTFEDAPPPNSSVMANTVQNMLTNSIDQTNPAPVQRAPNQGIVQLLADTVIIHPDYDAKTLENDIALVKLKQPVPYREDIQPICLPHQEEEFSGLDGYATGWGLVDLDKRQLPDTLQIVRLPIMTNKRCQNMYKKAGHDKVITEFDLCAGYAKGGMDACEGDSGGPLIVRRPNDNRWVLAGIVSNGVKCGEPLLPGVYTKVSKFIPWIFEQIRLHS